MPINIGPYEINGKKFTLSVGETALNTNCGATLAYGASITAMKRIGGFIDYVPFSPREVYAFLDKHVAPILKGEKLPEYTTGGNSGLGTKGFVVLSDNMRLSKFPDLDKPDDRPSSDYHQFGTKDFVNYLISRKIGVVWRGPATHNRNHPNDSVIVCWVWVPRIGNLVSAETDVFNAPENLQPEFPALVPVAEELIAKQRAVPSTEVDVSRYLEEPKSEPIVEDKKIYASQNVPPLPMPWRGILYDHIGGGNPAIIPRIEVGAAEEQRMFEVDMNAINAGFQQNVAMVAEKPKRKYVRRKGKETVTDELAKRNVPHMRAQAAAQPG